MTADAFEDIRTMLGLIQRSLPSAQRDGVGGRTGGGQTVAEEVCKRNSSAMRLWVSPTARNYLLEAGQQTVRHAIASSEVCH